MGRIGQSLAKIESFATGELEPAFEPYQGAMGISLYDDVDRMRIPVRGTTVTWHGKFGDTKKEAFNMIQHRLKLRHNKNEYEVKKGRRPEGLMFKAALDRPFINISEPMQDVTVPMRFQDMTEDEQEKIKTEYPKIEIEHSVMTDMPAELIRTDAPYEIDDLNAQDTNTFIDNDRGEHFTGISKNNAIDTLGSTLVPNYAVDMNKPVKATSVKELYEENNNPKHTVSQINMKQLNNQKAKQILGLYSGTPSGIRQMQDRFLRGF